MWDIAVAGNGDLMFDSRRDLAGTSGDELLEQRIRLRILIARGSWVFDEGRNLGSDLRSALGQHPEKARPQVETYIHEALRPIEDIEVLGIDLDTTNGEVQAVINFRVITTETDDPIPADDDIISVTAVTL